MERYYHHTHNKGDLAEARVMAALLEQGFPVFLPFGNALPYDLVFKNDVGFQTVQVKMCRLRNGAVLLYALQGIREIDFYGIYCPDNEKVYLVPWEVIGEKHQLNLRVVPLQSNHGGNRVIEAKQFELYGSIE